jgi:hypothetical protein
VNPFEAKEGEGLTTGVAPWLQFIERRTMPVRASGGGCVTPGFKAKTRCSSYVCPGSSCHTYGQSVNIENHCLYYIISYYKILLHVQKGLNNGMDPIKPQAVDRGFRTPAGVWRTAAMEDGSSLRKYLEKEGTEGNLTEVSGGWHGNGVRPVTSLNGGGLTHPTRGD